MCHVEESRVFFVIIHETLSFVRNNSLVALIAFELRSVGGIVNILCHIHMWDRLSLMKPMFVSFKAPVGLVC